MHLRRACWKVFDDRNNFEFQFWEKLILGNYLPLCIHKAITQENKVRMNFTVLENQETPAIRTVVIKVLIDSKIELQNVVIFGVSQ